MEKDQDFLGREPIGRLLVKMAVPTVVAQLINMLYNIVDRIYIGHMPVDGSMALTGVGVCMPIIMIVTAFAMLVATGGGPRASIAMGKGQNEQAEQILGNCFVLQILISAVLTAVLLLWNRELLMTFGASEETIGYATEYMDLYAVGTVFVQLTLGMNAFITAQGYARTGMLSVLIGAVCNIVLDPVFIFGFHMGVRGAALATILSQAASCLWVVAFLCGRKTTLRLRVRHMKLKPSVVFPCMALGLATFVMQASESIIAVCFNASLLRYGGNTAVGAMTIFTSVMQFAMLPMQGIGQGAQPIASYNYGAKNAERVQKTFRLLLVSCSVFAVVLWAAVMCFPGAFVGIFTPDEKLRQFAAPMLRIYCGCLLLFGVQVACQMTFVSLGKAGSSIVVAVFRKFVMLLPLIYLMPLLVEDRTLGVYLAEPVADLIAVSFTAALFFFQFRKAMRGLRQAGTN